MLKKNICKIVLFLFPLYLLLGNDDIIQTGRMPNFDFFELLDVEVYSPDVVYTFGMGGLFFLDVSPPDDPLLIGIYQIGGLYNRFYNCKAYDTLAIAAARFSGLYIIDISRLSNPDLHTIHKTKNYSYESVDTYQNIAYAAVHENGIEIIDIKEPNVPVSIETLSGFNNTWDVFVKDDLLFVADGLSGIQIFSISDPWRPRYLSSIKTSGYARELVVADSLVFVALGSAGFDIIDVSDPVQPVFLSNFNNSFGITNHLSYSDNYIYSATWELVNAVDVSNPLNPILMATEDTPTRAMGVASYGNRIFVADWFSMRIYNYFPYSTPDIHIKPLSFDFGITEIGQPVTQYAEIYNLGESDLFVSDININNNNIDIYPNSIVVSPNSVDSVKIIFTPQDTIESYNKLKFISNDPDEELWQILLHTGDQDLTPGDSAPKMILDDLYGTQYDLFDYRGKVVLLSFFASW